jgi:hypothetical protein
MKAEISYRPGGFTMLRLIAESTAERKELYWVQQRAVTVTYEHSNLAKWELESIDLLLPPRDHVSAWITDVVAKTH